MWHLSAPRSAVFARDSSPSAKAGSGGCWPPVSGMGISVFASASHSTAMTDGKAGFAFPDCFHPGGRCRRIRQTQPPCVPHRHARRAVRGVKRQGWSDTPPLPPCRRRETIFRRPFWHGLTSVPNQKRRPRLTATPGSVSVTGWGDCRHGLRGWGKWERVLSGSEGVPGRWILGSSPRMTVGRRECPSP